MLVAQKEVEAPQQLLERLAESRVRTDEIFDIVAPDSLYERPIPERHRIIFYLGHLEAFDWNLLRERILGMKPFDADLDKLFAFGIDPVNGKLPTDQPGDWPSLAATRDYVHRIRESIDAGLAALDFSAVNSTPAGADYSPGKLLNVAIEHRLMHAETLAYMLHQLPLERKVRKVRAPELVVSPITPRMIEIPEGHATLGMSSHDGAFGWDNEFEAQTVDVPGFAIDKYKVTNRQYLDFITAGGYKNPDLWREEDWKWRTAHNIRHPVFWVPENDRWHLRTMFDEIPLPINWPVYVSHAEASAYARWANKSLPTEAQWQRAAYGTSNDVETFFPWGDEEPDGSKGNFDFHSWDPTPVNFFPDGDSAFGVADLLGNGWEWTSSKFEPFPGFQRFSFYPGYSADFFDGNHYVMKGASPRTSACMLRRSFRNWFQPHYQYVYAGFRCVSK